MIRFLLDTNVPSEVRKPHPDDQLSRWLAARPREELELSVITFSEVIKGIAQHSDPVQSEQLQHWFDTVLRRWFDGRVLPVISSIAERAGQMIGEKAKAGRVLALADALIAATAVEHELILVTRNVRDFSGIDVRIINP